MNNDRLLIISCLHDKGFNQSSRVYAPPSLLARSLTNIAARRNLTSRNGCTTQLARFQQVENSRKLCALLRLACSCCFGFSTRKVWILNLPAQKFLLSQVWCGTKK